MPTRLITALLIAIGSFVFVAPSEVDARATPKCRGKTATLWLTEPGTLYGTVGNDVIVGSSGDDVIIGGLNQGDGIGVDIVCGGAGDDQINVQGVGSIADGGSGDDTINVHYGAKGYGGSGNDLMLAQYDAWVYGGSGNDSLNAYDGGSADGGSGDDRVQGPRDAFKLLGGSGKDFVIDNDGAQFMDCGSDADTYYTAGTPTIRRCEIVFT